MNRYLLALGMFAPLGLAFGGEPDGGISKGPVGKDPGKAVQEPAPPATGRWRVSAGAVWRSIGGIDWHSGRPYSASFRMPSFVGGDRHGGTGSAGPAGSHADRIYDDGTVKIGSPTAATGDTWNWSYQSASQQSGDSLLFHTRGGNSSRTSHGGSVSPLDWSDDDPDGFGPYVSLDYMFDLSQTWAIGPQFSFMFASLDSSHTGSNFAGFQERRDYSHGITDRYGLDGIVPPNAPYQGSYNGPGPLLRNIPDRRTVSSRQVGAQRATFANTVHEDIDIDLYTFSLGFQSEFRSGPLSLRGGAGLGLTVVDLEASRTETLHASGAGKSRTIRRWSDRTDDTDVLPGFYLSLEAGYAFNQNLSLSVFGRYDWMGDVSGSVGPAGYSVDLDGWTVGAALSWTW